mgnify:CR=1 FL=1
MDLDNMKLDQTREQLSPEGKAAFDLGVEQAFRLHFRALRQIDNKVYRLPIDAKALEVEVLANVNEIWEADRACMIVSKSPNGKEAANG